MRNLPRVSLCRFTPKQLVDGEPCQSPLRWLWFSHARASTSLSLSLPLAQNDLGLPYLGENLVDGVTQMRNRASHFGQPALGIWSHLGGFSHQWVIILRQVSASIN